MRAIQYCHLVSEEDLPQEEDTKFLLEIETISVFFKNTTTPCLTRCDQVLNAFTN